MTPWLSVVGIGEDGLPGLSAAARALVDSADVLIGGERHLAMIPPALNGTSRPERLSWPKPLTTMVERIVAMRGRSVCVLATGDPMQFGVGATLARHVAPEEMTIIPALSAFALAAARLRWPLEGVSMLSLHGRSLETLAPLCHPEARLLILSEDRATPAAVAGFLAERGFGDSWLVALAHMGGPRESRNEGRACDWRADVPDFHTLAVECMAGPGAVWHSPTGLPDDAFEHDGKLTKREARALALAKLMPHAGAYLIDVGAGCGSIAIEWMRAAGFGRATALEPRLERRAMAARNAAALGVPGLDIRDATAPEALASLPNADAIFIGGGLSEQAIDASIGALKAGGRLVAHAVTLESEALLLSAYAQHNGELVRLSVARAEPIGPFSGWRPAMPVTQWSWRRT